MKSSRLAGDVAIVTGSASGIDREIALELARHGAIVACADIDEKGNAETVAAIQQEGGEAFAVYTNVGDTDSVKEAFKQVYERTGKIDILINGAAVAKFNQLPDLDDKEWDFVININLTGAMRCLREAYRYMKATGGRIVQLSSTSGKSGGAWAGPHYVASKSGMIGLTKYCAGQWARDGIRVNAVCPGTTDTPLTMRDEVADIINAGISRVPMGRVAQPSDIAGAVMFLVTDESAYVTGITLDVTGGRYIYTN